MAEVSASVILPASAQRVWDLLVDWPAQGSWMLFTTVSPTRADGRGVGGQVEAVTSFGPLGVRDPMTITEWEPPSRCVVAHEGRVVRGSGIFEVEPVGPGSARITWTEQLDLPLGALGRLGWPLARPVSRLGLLLSLRRMAPVLHERG